MAKYVLKNKASIGFGMRSIARGDEIFEEEFNSLPERVKPFFVMIDDEPAQTKQEKTDPKDPGDKVSIEDPDNPEKVKMVSEHEASDAEKAAIDSDKKENYRTSRETKNQKK